MLTANLFAMLMQNLSAKLGIATGSRAARGVPRPGRGGGSFVALWLQAEPVAMATDLAEFAGAAMGLHLLFGLSMLESGAAGGGGRVRGARPARCTDSGGSKR